AFPAPPELQGQLPGASVELRLLRRGAQRAREALQGLGEGDSLPRGELDGGRLQVDLLRVPAGGGTTPPLRREDVPPTPLLSPTGLLPDLREALALHRQRPLATNRKVGVRGRDVHRVEALGEALGLVFEVL